MSNNYAKYIDFSARLDLAMFLDEWEVMLLSSSTMFFCARNTLGMFFVPETHWKSITGNSRSRGWGERTGDSER